MSIHEKIDLVIENMPERLRYNAETELHLSKSLWNELYCIHRLNGGYENVNTYKGHPIVVNGKSPTGIVYK